MEFHFILRCIKRCRSVGELIPIHEALQLDCDEACSWCPRLGSCPEHVFWSGFAIQGVKGSCDLLNRVRKLSLAIERKATELQKGERNGNDDVQRGNPVFQYQS